MNVAWARAVVQGDAETVRTLLAAGADADALDRYGQTGLMLAAQRGHEEVVEVLVAHGARLDVTAKFNLSALMLAVIAGHAGVARRLARAGADLRIEGRGAYGFQAKTAHDLAVGRGLESVVEDLKPR